MAPPKPETIDEKLTRLLVEVEKLTDDAPVILVVDFLDWANKQGLCLAQLQKGSLIEAPYGHGPLAARWASER